jgi:hypothetical protein
MASFQKTLIVIAAIVLLLALSLISLMLYNTKKDNWPPIVPQCPDWWKAITDPSGNLICKNVQNLGTCSADFNPGASQYLGSDGLCKKREWANGCSISWDGVTYGVDNPCAST